MRGLAFYQLTDYETALADMNAALKREPESLDLLVYRADIQQRKGNDPGLGRAPVHDSPVQRQTDHLEKDRRKQPDDGLHLRKDQVGEVMIGGQRHAERQEQASRQGQLKQEQVGFPGSAELPANILG